MDVPTANFDLGHLDNLRIIYNHTPNISTLLQSVQRGQQPTFAAFAPLRMCRGIQVNWGLSRRLDDKYRYWHAIFTFQSNLEHKKSFALPRPKGWPFGWKSSAQNRIATCISILQEKGLQDIRRRSTESLFETDVGNRWETDVGFPPTSTEWAIGPKDELQDRFIAFRDNRVIFTLQNF